MHRPQAGRMNNRHLPAGQGIPGNVGGGVGPDINGLPGPGAGGAPIVSSNPNMGQPMNLYQGNMHNGHGNGGINRRRGTSNGYGGYNNHNHHNNHMYPPAYHPHQQPYQAHMMGMPNNYMYGGPSYYNQMSYPMGPVNPNPYMPYPQYHHHRPNMPYGGQPYNPVPSPVASTPYPPPSMPPPHAQPQTPSSIHGSHASYTPPPPRDFVPGQPWLEPGTNINAPIVVSSDAPIVSSQPIYRQNAPPAIVSSTTTNNFPSVVSSTPIVQSPPKANPVEVKQPPAPTVEPMRFGSLDFKWPHVDYKPQLPWHPGNKLRWPEHVKRYSKPRQRINFSTYFPSEPSSVDKYSVANMLIAPVATADNKLETVLAKSSPAKAPAPIVPVVPAVPRTVIISESKIPVKDEKAAHTRVQGDVKTQSQTSESTQDSILTPNSSEEEESTQEVSSTKEVLASSQTTPTAPTPVTIADPQNTPQAAPEKPVSSMYSSSTTVPTATATPTPTPDPTLQTTSVASPDAAPIAMPAPANLVSWASLLKTNITKASAVASETAAKTSGNVAKTVAPVGTTNGDSASASNNKVKDLSATIKSFRVDSIDKITFLEPRGLVNGGNMCYMNSILQVLLHCIPFYNFLSEVGPKITLKHKDEVPLTDAMVEFMNEFKPLATAPSFEKLHQVIRAKDRQFGESFSPNYFYSAIRESKRFANMEQGHQQDAEEFLGLLLQVLDDECNAIVSKFKDSVDGSSGDKAEKKDWQEVGPRQKSSVSRVSGTSSTSPISHIFGGYTRCELSRPTAKPSVTTQFFQSLQLDIDVPHIINILDALKHMSRKEVVEDNGQKGRVTTQTQIHGLPPVLVLHLKRFQFNATGGTVKLWKKVSYPMELELPRECVSRQLTTRLQGEGKSFPKYRLSAVVYHHGKNASVGHYTVDVRRQDGSEWIHIDDTKIESLGSEDVAHAGSDETQKNGSCKSDSNANNRFGIIDDDGEEDDLAGWKQVPASANGNKRGSAVATGNGTATATAAVSASATKGTFKGKTTQSAYDSKVAYILFYQRV